MTINLIKPNWPAPMHIHAYTTTRQGGYSMMPYTSLNLADHVGDNIKHVKQNRNLLKQSLQLTNEPVWLIQTHGTNVIQADPTSTSLTADASFTEKSEIICAVLTADCLPVLICDSAGTMVAAIHAGWRGLAAGIIETTIKKLPATPNNLLAWLGPAIGPKAFEVGQDVYEHFLQSNSKAALAFENYAANKWLANIYWLAEQRLRKTGITHIYGGEYCTYTDTTQFYSYRRNQNTGRMASLIWIGKN